MINARRHVLQYFWRELESDFDVIGPYFTFPSTIETFFTLYYALSNRPTLSGTLPLSDKLSHVPHYPYLGRHLSHIQSNLPS